MHEALSLVREFHREFGLHVATSPTLLSTNADSAIACAVELRQVAQMCRQRADSPEGLCARLALAVEELAEWAEAHEAGDLVAAADAWGDRMYVLLGDAIATGLPGAEILAEVHRSNMTKTAALSPGGKPIKGAGFEPPMLAEIVKAATNLPSPTVSSH